MASTPDIVPSENLVTPDLLLGWQPIVEIGEVEDRERILNGLVTPKEMPLQVAFGIIKHGIRVNENESYERLFAREAVKASDGIKGFIQHEASYIAAVALWHNRDAVLDYPNSFAEYSSHYDGYSRKLIFSEPTNLCSELYRNIDDEYIPNVKAGHKSRRDVEVAEAWDLIAELRLAGDEETAQELISVYKLGV